MREKFWDAIGFFGAAKEEGKAEKGWSEEKTFC
jgi:hypothetical protein